MRCAKYNILSFILLCVLFSTCASDFQLGPDPWHYEMHELKFQNNEIDIPPDLRTPVKKERTVENKLGNGEFWFRRILTIVLKSGQLKKNEDNSVEVSLQMRFDEDKWSELDEYLTSNTALSDMIFRRTVGYVEEAIYKPTITDKIKMAWGDYIQVYLIEYKTQITWSLAVVAVTGGILWLWQHMSHKHVIVIIFCLLYVYEVIISYKDAEKQELEKFISAVNTCKWYFWTSDCDVPSPDPLVFMKHMNPMKIGIRMFTSLISEPMIVLNSTIKVTIQSMTDGLWYPFDRITYMILIVIINISLIFLLVMIVFNFIFNIPFNFSMLGIARIGVGERKRSLFSDNTAATRPQPVEDGDRLSGDRLDRLFNFVSLALNNAQNGSNANHAHLQNISGNVPKIKRSASTGRLPSERSTLRGNSNEQVMSGTLARKRGNAGFRLGSGDQ